MTRIAKIFILQLIIINALPAQTNKYDSLFCYNAKGKLLSFHTDHIQADFKDLMLTKYSSRDSSIVFNPLEMELNMISQKQKTYNIYFDHKRPFLRFQDSLNNTQTLLLNIYQRDTNRKSIEGEHTSLEKVYDLVVSGVYDGTRLKRIDVFLGGRQVTLKWSFGQQKSIDFIDLNSSFKLHFRSGQIDFIIFRSVNKIDSNEIVFSRLKRLMKGFSWIYYSPFSEKHMGEYYTIYMLRRNGKLKRKYMKDMVICRG